MARINIPKNADQLIQLAKNIVAKHTTDGVVSPLGGLDMADMNTKTSTADTENKSAAQCRRDAEKATQNRDNALGSGAGGPVKGTVEHYVKSARDVLLGLNKGNEQRLGDWGFDVDTSVRAGNPAPTTPPSP